MNARLFVAAAALGALSACSGNQKDDGLVNITANTADGNVSISVPGVTVDAKLPSDMFTKSDFDIDGVKLPAGAKIETMNVKAGDKDTHVRMSFSAPGDIAAIRKHFLDGFAAKSVTVTQSGDTLSGKTDDDNAFTIALTPGAAAGTTKGDVTIVDAGK